jgi:hypothetical protein
MSMKFKSGDRIILTNDADGERAVTVTETDSRSIWYTEAFFDGSRKFIRDSLVRSDFDDFLRESSGVYLPVSQYCKDASWTIKKS